MLARPETSRCIECGTPWGSPLFHAYYGDPAQGPAYWSDRGILCSPACSLKHQKRRIAEGTTPSAPAGDPFELVPSHRR